MPSPPPSRDESDTTFVIPDEQGQPVALEMRSATLEILRGPDEGRRAVVDRPVFRVGSAPGNDLQLTDGTVSKFHFTIQTSARGYIIEDLLSTNGVMVGETRIQSAFLDPGSLITAGLTVLRFTPQVERYQVSLSTREELAGLVATSQAMRKVFTEIEQYAPLRYGVLVYGETGTGKEGVSRALHVLSGRPSSAWVVVDCSCLTRDMIEDTLFGHVKGAFTGAAQARQGAFARARDGTLFLDEIGELPMDLQAKLLRVLQEGTFFALGSDTAQSSNFRLVSATNRDLAREVNQGRFREDLYQRLCTLTVRLPPLRERPDDVPVLLERFIQDAARELNTTPHKLGRIPTGVVAALQRQAWPGNVRQLRNYVLRLMIRREAGPLAPEDWLDPALIARPTREQIPENGIDTLVAGLTGESNRYQEGKRRVLDAYERQFVLRYLRDANLVVARAATLAGMHRQEFTRLMRRHAITREDVQPGDG